VDKGFGFSAIYGEGIADLPEGDGVEFELKTARRVRGRRASSAPRR